MYFELGPELELELQIDLDVESEGEKGSHVRLGQRVLADVIRRGLGPSGVQLMMELFDDSFTLADPFRQVPAMPIPARLSRILHRTLGDQGADDLVNWMTTVESGRSELNELMVAWRVATDSRFVAIDARFSAIDVRFDGVDRQLDGIDRRFDKIDGRLDSLDARMNGIEARLTDLFRWSFVFWIGTVGAMMAIVHFMR